jgi:DNA-binding NarL/FixJ family response regulator|tara:strand:+ start:263 stop:556 length:294 start_codon:yes stop_codon:yes gene_type:complete
MQQKTFDGSDYDHSRDSQRLSKQQEKIFNLMRDGEWRTLRHIAYVTNAPEASVSAQLRNFRKPKFGNHTLEKDYHGDGLYYYRLILNTEDPRQGKLL